MNWHHHHTRADGALAVSIFGEIGLDCDGQPLIETIRRHSGKIALSINSAGGCCNVALQVLDSLQGKTVETLIIHAASAATILLGAGPVKMRSNGNLMIHQPTNATLGTADFHRERAGQLDQLEQRFLQIYHRKTGLPLAELRAMMAQVFWMDATQAKALGFCDEITEPPQIADVTADQPATAPDGPTESEQFFFEILNAHGKLTVRDKGRFAHNLNSWLALRVVE